MKRIWLTGASSGIGAAMADILLSQGHFLAVSARNAKALEKLHTAFPEQVLELPGDLTDQDQVRAMAEQIQQAWGHLDQVILNAGTCEYVDASHFEANLIERVMRANVFSAAYCVEAALPLLRKAARPHLVAVCSSVTYLPLPRSKLMAPRKQRCATCFNRCVLTWLMRVSTSRWSARALSTRRSHNTTIFQCRCAGQ